MRIREQRARLVERAARQREALAQGVAALSVPIALADRGMAVARFIKARPALVAAAATLVMVLQPRRSLRWVQRGVALWQTWRWLAVRF